MELLWYHTQRSTEAIKDEQPDKCKYGQRFQISTFQLWIAPLMNSSTTAFEVAPQVLRPHLLLVFEIMGICCPDKDYHFTATSTPLEVSISSSKWRILAAVLQVPSEDLKWTCTTPQIMRSVSNSSYVVGLLNYYELQMRVSLKDPSLPFVLLHNEITLRPRCFVRVPVRFVPSCHSINTIKSYSGVLEGTVQVASQTLTCSVRLAGSSY